MCCIQIIVCIWLYRHIALVFGNSVVLLLKCSSIWAPNMKRLLKTIGSRGVWGKAIYFVELGQYTILIGISHVGKTSVVHPNLCYFCLLYS